MLDKHIEDLQEQPLRDDYVEKLNETRESINKILTSNSILMCSFLFFLLINV
jgi:hypothetical protein